MIFPESQPEIHPLIRNRRSTRAFSSKPVSEESILRLLESARWAPSSTNEQPWRFFVATQTEAEKYKRIFDALNPGNQIWADKAQVLIATFAKTTFSRNNLPNHHALHDVGLAVAQLTLQATSEGIFVHQLAGFNASILKTNLNFSDDLQPVTVLAIGYPGNLEDISPELRDRELAVRKRKALAEIVMSG